MVSMDLLHPIFDDEHLLRGLQDPEARILIEWLVECAEGLGRRIQTSASIHEEVRQLCRRARSISRFVKLWCYDEDHGAACQLAASERFRWPLPALAMDPCDLMVDILAWQRRES